MTLLDSHRNALESHYKRPSENGPSEENHSFEKYPKNTHENAFTRASCSLCNDTLLRHVRQRQLCWFCPTCRHDTPHESEQHENEQSQEKPLKTAFTRNNVVKSLLTTAKQSANQSAAQQTIRQSALNDSRRELAQPTQPEPTAPAA